MLMVHTTTACILNKGVSRSLLAFHNPSSAALKSLSKQSTGLFLSSRASSAESNRSSSSTSSSSIMNINIQGPELPPIPSTAKRLFMVRHGEVINPGGDRAVYYGSMDVSLSPLGEDEAKVSSLTYCRYFCFQYCIQFLLFILLCSSKYLQKKRLLGNI